MYAKKVFWSDLAKKPLYFWSAIALLFLLVITIIVPNVKFIMSPFTKEINGKVVDALSNKPISGATVIIDWYYYYGEIQMHSSVIGSVNQQIITTGASGEFKVPKRLRSLAVNFFPLYLRGVGDVTFVALHHDYKYDSILDNSNKLVLVKKYRYSNIDEMVKDYGELKMLAEAKARRGQHNSADAIEKIALEQAKKYFGYRER